MRLFIAEKPSLARAIADVLPKPHRRGDAYGNNDVVTWCVGHLLEQAQPDAYDSRYARWSLADLPIIPENGACSRGLRSANSSTRLKAAARSR